MSFLATTQVRLESKWKKKSRTHCLSLVAERMRILIAGQTDMNWFANTVSRWQKK